MASYLTKRSDSDKLNRSMPLRHAPSKDLSFAFPETAASSMGLEHEDACVVVTDSTGIVALTQSPKKSTSQNPIVLSNGCALWPNPANSSIQDLYFKHL
jgi:hypothetical protein